MSGKLKIKGNMMLATKLDTVIKSAKDALASAPAPAAAPSGKSEPPAAASLDVAGFESSSVFTQIYAGIAGAPDAEKEQFMKKAKGIFQFDIKVSFQKIMIHSQRIRLVKWQHGH